MGLGWQPISTAPLNGRGPFSPWMILGHKEHKWIRFGHFMETAGLWYYSGTNERARYSEVVGGKPTHWMPMPDINTIGEDEGADGSKQELGDI